MHYVPVIANPEGGDYRQETRTIRVRSRLTGRVHNGTVAALRPPIVLGRFGTENATGGPLDIAIAGSTFLSPLAVSTLRGTTGVYTLPLVALGVVTVLGVALLYRGTTPEGERGNSRSQVRGEIRHLGMANLSFGS